MERYVTLGADENGHVYGLELGEDGRWKRNSLGLSTPCGVVRPMTRETYEYLTEDPQAVKEWWQAAVADERTELGLDDWFKELDKDKLLDQSFVFELLDDVDNPTVAKRYPDFRKYAERRLVRSRKVSAACADDVYEWEAAGWYQPKKPFVVEFAPKKLLEEYYAHLRRTYKEFEG